MSHPSHVAVNWEPMQRAAEHAEQFLARLPERPVTVAHDTDDLRAALGGPLPDDGASPAGVIDLLAAGADPGLVATAGPRYFGFVVGGSLPAAAAADWLVTAWDQNAGFHALSPASAVVEEITATWVLDLLGLPASASIGFVTGGQAANVVGLAAARHHAFAARGWDVEARGLVGAPGVSVIAGEQAHATIFTALRLLGLGCAQAVRVGADDQGRMQPPALAAALAATASPAIVCAQAGNVNTGAFDPLDAIADVCEQHGAWLHVDGAFGLWAAASAGTRHLTRGASRADSWAVDAHKWLNVPQDCGLAIVAHPGAHRASMSLSAAYMTTDDVHRDPTNWVPESSRRARATPVYAALRSLGRSGVDALVERCCHHARRMGELLAADPSVHVLNDVVLNQVLVGFDGRPARALEVIAAVQRDATCWLGGTRWDDRDVMRVSCSNWSTTDADVERSADAILRAAARYV